VRSDNKHQRDDDSTHTEYCVHVLERRKRAEKEEGSSLKNERMTAA